MILLNFSHIISDDALSQLSDLVEKRTKSHAGQTDLTVEQIMVSVQFDPARSFVTQVVELVDGLSLSPTEWQNASILVNPPALNIIAVTLLAELHGRMGYFPTVVRLRPVEGSLPRRFEVAEIIDLSEVRDAARLRR